MTDITDFHGEAIQTVMEFGFGVIGVFPVDHDGFHFGYTYGRALVNEPDLIVTGISQHAHYLLNDVVEHWSDHPGVGVPWRLADEEVGGHVMTLPVPDERLDELMTFTRHFAPDGFLALQVIWQDDEGLWPWDWPEYYGEILDPTWKDGFPR